MTISRSYFDELYREVATWRRDSPRQDRGALRHLTPPRVTAAARLVRDGMSISLGRPLDTQRRIDNPEPAEHRMTMLPDEPDGGPVQFAKDYIGVDYHNDDHSHLDALCHVAFDQSIYGGQSSQTVTESGATTGTVALLADGLVGRGVLVDAARARGVPWLEPGDQVSVEDIERALGAQRVELIEGDIMFVRTGHARRQAELPPWDTAHAKAGLDPEVARILASRGITALGGDGNNDTAPSVVEGVGFPIHVLALQAMGVHLLDYLNFEALAEQCQRLGRWEFLCVVAPLLIERGTGSPVNPIAVL